MRKKEHRLGIQNDSTCLTLVIKTEAFYINFIDAMNVKIFLNFLFPQKISFPHIVAHFSARHKYFVVVFRLLRAFLLYLHRHKEAFRVKRGCFILIHDESFSRKEMFMITDRQGSDT